jgi:hypothetical protein
LLDLSFLHLFIYFQEQLEDEQEELTKDIGKFERQAINISDQIKTEAQVYFNA